MPHLHSFDDTMDGIANPINGTMSIVPETWYGDGTPVFDEYVASFDLHVSLDPASGGRITGSLDYRQVSTTDMRHIYTWNDTLISDDQTKVQVWWNPLIETDEDIGTDRELLTITGTGLHIRFGVCHDFSHSTVRLPDQRRSETGFGEISPDRGPGQSDHHGPGNRSGGVGGARSERGRHHRFHSDPYLGGTGFLSWIGISAEAIPRIMEGAGEKPRPTSRAGIISTYLQSLP